MSTKVVVGMSGGIDSSVAAYLLKQQGYHVIGVQMKYWSEDTSCTLNTQTGEILDGEGKVANRFRKIMENKCCSDESIMVAREVCQHLGIPFYVHAISDFFKEQIVDYYLQEIQKGLTPNPCTRCNRLIKFGSLLDFARQIGATHVATGHYARIEQKGEEDLPALFLPKDENKDQTYFLYEITKEQLPHILLPLGDLDKSEVRAIAEDAGLTVYKKNYSESQGLCFFQEKTPEAFLERQLPDSPLMVPGSILNVQGQRIGTHKGLMNYTIGQRRGIDLGGLSKPLFVLSKDVENNTLIVGTKEEMYGKHLIIGNLNIQSREVVYPLKVQGRIRYRMPLTNATIIPMSNPDEYLVTFEEPVYAITPGQAAVFYDHGRLVGGGIIIRRHFP